MSNTKELQLKILEIYKAVRIILEKHNLRYFAIGGTAIGAVRHGGFIPWDGDMDIAMPREDYNKFLDILDRELPEKYFLRRASSSLHIFTKYAKVIDKETTLIEKAVQKFPERDGGVFFDIFPVDGISDNKLVAFYDITILNIVNLLDRLFAFDILYLGTILNWTGFPKFCRKVHERVASKHSVYKTKEFAFKFLYPKNNTIKFKSSWISELIDLKFEDTTVKIFKDYDDYLKTNFGNYMQLPPLSEQQDNHFPVYLNLEKPYTEYRSMLKKQKGTK